MGCLCSANRLSTHWLTELAVNEWHGCWVASGSVTCWHMEAVTLAAKHPMEQ